MAPRSPLAGTDRRPKSHLHEAASPAGSHGKASLSRAHDLRMSWTLRFPRRAPEALGSARSL
eukprot:4648364-Alexandrium_andersonii.AAC.1